jgi:hypothetical protein
VTGNPKTSKWYATPRDARKRKKLEITLSDEAREKLERMAGIGGKSALIERLILEADEK